MKTCMIPTDEIIPEPNQIAIEELINSASDLPDLFMVLSYLKSESGKNLQLNKQKSALNGREREVISLIASQVKHCFYCLSDHIEIGKMEGFNDNQVLEILQSHITFDNKLDALAKFAESMTANNGYVPPFLINNFYAAGYNKCNLIDVILTVSERIIANYITALTGEPSESPVRLNYQVLYLMLRVSPTGVRHRENFIFKNPTR